MGFSPARWAWSAVETLNPFFFSLRKENLNPLHLLVGAPLLPFHARAFSSGQRLL
jgi:hypothetical protein